MAGAYNNMGAMLLFAKDYSLALAYFEKALNVLSKSSNNHSMLAMTYSNMVTAFAGLGDYNEAADYNRRAVTTTTSGNMGLNNVISKNYEDELD
jgi:tetratricopeptide (TPR) repeat protein